MIKEKTFYMANVSRKKTEQRAITKVRALIDDTEILSHNFNENDKGISFDVQLMSLKVGLIKNPILKVV